MSSPIIKKNEVPKITTRIEFSTAGKINTAYDSFISYDELIETAKLIKYETQTPEVKIDIHQTMIV